MNKSMADRINEETYMGTVPILKGERIYNFRDITLISTGFGIAAWCYVQGAYIASMVPFGIGVFVTVIPMLLAGLIMLFNVIIPARHGIDLWLYQKVVFGQKFAFVIFMVATLTAWGWYAINSQVMGGATTSLLGYAGLDLGEGWNAILALLCPIIGMLIAISGPRIVKIAAYIAIPAVVFVGVLLVIKTLSTTSIEELLSIEPMYGDTYGSLKIAFLMMVDVSFAFSFSWYASLGGLSRITKTENSAYWGQLLGIILGTSFFVIIGLLTATLMSGQGVYSPYPSDWLVNFGGIWCILAQFAIIVGNIMTQVLGVYTLTVATKIFKPTWNFKYIAIGYTVYCSVLILWRGIWDYYNIFLAAVVMVAAPALALITADFYFVRKCKFSFKSAFLRGGYNSYQYTGGFNLVSLVSFLTGLCAYLAIYDPVHYVIRNEILLVLTPTGFSYLLTAITYILLNKIPYIKKYVLKDTGESIEG